MTRTKLFARNVLATSCACLLLTPPVIATEPVTPAEAKAAAQDQVIKQATPNGVAGQLTLTVRQVAGYR